MKLINAEISNCKLNEFMRVFLKKRGFRKLMYLGRILLELEKKFKYFSQTESRLVSIDAEDMVWRKMFQAISSETTGAVALVTEFKPN